MTNDQTCMEFYRLREIYKEIYNHLGDCLSIGIFENRLMYSLAEDIKYIKNIVSLQNFPIDEWNEHYSKFGSVIIYGAGIIGQLFALLCDQVSIIAFCDRDENKQKESLFGHSVIPVEELAEKYKDKVVIITVKDKKAADEINDDLLKRGFSENQLLAFREKLVDSLRKERAKQYFETDIVRPIPSNDEVFIDGGSLNGESAKNFIAWCGGKYEKIVSFEPNPKQYHLCIDKSKGIKNMIVHPYGLWNENTELWLDDSNGPAGTHISCYSGDAVRVKGVKLDSILNGEKATFIKLDVEGAELNALIGAEETIRKYKPKLAISLYHKPEDIWEIPAYIISLQKGYRLYLRHYSPWHEETVLYAV